VINQASNAREDSLSLKEPAGWFAAGASFRRALWMLSDGAFKLFAHLCLEADRRTGRFEAVHAELAKAVGKSRRIVGKNTSRNSNIRGYARFDREEISMHGHASRFEMSTGRIAGNERSKMPMAKLLTPMSRQSRAALLLSAVLLGSSVLKMCY